MCSAGGFYDQIIPPFEGVPDDEAPCQAPCRTFDFRRLGLRTTGMMLSPWVGKGAVYQEPQVRRQPRVLPHCPSVVATSNCVGLTPPSARCEKAPFGTLGRSPFNTSQFELTSVSPSHFFRCASTT